MADTHSRQIGSTDEREATNTFTEKQSSTGINIYEESKSSNQRLGSILSVIRLEKRMPAIRRVIKNSDTETFLAEMAKGQDPNAKSYEARHIKMAILSMGKHEQRCKSHGT